MLPLNIELCCWFKIVSLLASIWKETMMARSRGAGTKGLVMVPLSHTRLCVYVCMCECVGASEGVCVCVCWEENETVVKQSCTLCRVGKDAKSSPPAHCKVTTPSCCIQQDRRAAFKVWMSRIRTAQVEQLIKSINKFTFRLIIICRLIVS